jgi:hypothetical protein
MLRLAMLFAPGLWSMIDAHRPILNLLALADESARYVLRLSATVNATAPPPLARRL